ncbi:hypothetical protein H0H93_000451 [Arthromyces matolae]|nr:hypothetical protein H0H93_000451 [Arthromyces matolae]
MYTLTKVVGIDKTEWRAHPQQQLDEDKGWLRLNDVLESVAKTITPDDTGEKIPQRLKQKRLNELQKWGKEGGSSDHFAAAEAASPTDGHRSNRPPVISLAHRRFRTEFFEPLLAVPKINGKSKAKNRIPKATAINNRPLGPQGRLARGVKELLESKDLEEQEYLDLATSLANSLRIVGVRVDHPLRKKLDKFVASAAKAG